MITGTVVVFIPHVFSISISRSLYFVSFSIIFKEVFLSVGIDISISRQVLSFLSFTTMSGLFAFISLSVWIGTTTLTLFVGMRETYISVHTCTTAQVLQQFQNTWPLHSDVSVALKNEVYNNSCNRYSMTWKWSGSVFWNLAHLVTKFSLDFDFKALDGIFLPLECLFILGRMLFTA